MLAGIFNYRQITQNLASSGQPDEGELAEIAAAGYKAVINLALHNDPRYSLKDEAGTVQALGLTYVHIPVAFDAPTEHDLQLFFAAMDKQTDTKTWVHCAANKRVSVFLGLYWHIHLGRSLEESFSLQKDVWEPDEVWKAFIQHALQ